MNPGQAVQQIATWLIRASCRRLPEEMRAERYREWSAELDVILDDRSVPGGLVRAVRALRYSAGISRATRHLGPPRAAAGRRDGAPGARPVNLGVRAAIGFITWLVVVFGFVGLVRAFPGRPGWTIAILAILAVCFDAFCLTDIARAGEVRYLPKWAWALICLIQAPAGGIAYLSIGRIGNPRPAPPGPARS